MRKLRLLTVLGLALVLAGTNTATAQDAAITAPGMPPVNLPSIGEPLPAVDTSKISYDRMPNPTMLPALKPFADRQAKFFYMGRAAGLDGWFMTLPDNFVQIVYTSLDGKQLIIGFIVDEEGRNLTEQQMVNLRERDQTVNQMFTDRVEDAKSRLARDRGFQELMTNLNMDKPGDALYAEITQAPAIDMGNTSAPLLMMVIDPQCPFCKQAWKKLEKDYVNKGKLMVRLVPVAILGEDSMRMSELLLDPNGKELWTQFAASDFDKNKLSGTATADGKRRYALNAALYNRWKLKGTPFFAYRSKGGGIKVLNELPKNWDDLVKDIAPAAPVTLPTE